jgi:lipase chaperone LimK
MRPKAITIAAGLALAAVIAAGWWGSAPWLDSTPLVTEVDAGPVGESDESASQDERATIASATAPSSNDSLRDTDVDGALHLDARGQPVPDREMRRVFDYFLARSGEQSPEAIRSALLEHLHSRSAASGLRSEALATVLAWFDAYVALERDSVAIAQREAEPAAAMARVRSLRRERLGPVLADNWYAEEERDYDRADARRKLWADRSLDPAARERRLAELDADLDPGQRELQAQSAQLDVAMQQSREFERNRTDASTRFAEREALYGRDAAQRLAELDQRKAQWNDRVRSYAAQRQRVLADVDLSDAQRQQRLSGLMQGFDPNERRRVDALTRNGMLPGR